MRKWTKVELFERIRRAHEAEQLSIRELSRRFGVHRRTVRQALASALPPRRKPDPACLSCARPVCRDRRPLAGGRS
jgi:hypothetical protein